MPEPKTLKVAVYPDGTRYTIKRERGHYWFKRGSGSNTMQGAIESIEAEGGHIETKPNPNYRKPTLFPFS